MRRSTTTLALAMTAALALSACSGDGDVQEAGEGEAAADALTQEQTAELLLTQEEFPVEGWTRGEPEPVETGDSDEETADGEDSFEDLFEGTDGIPQECLDALNRVGDLGSENVQAGSKVSFDGPEDEGSIIPAEAELVVASFEGGESPLSQLAGVNEHCTDLEVEEQGMTMTLSFAELGDMEGTKMTMSIAGLNVEMIMGGQSEGSTVVALMATGLEEDQVKQVVEAQMTKVQDAG